MLAGSSTGEPSLQGGPSGPASSMTPRLPPDQTPPTNHEPFINSRLDKVSSSHPGTSPPPRCP